jgi:hypothetical protein
MKHVPSRLIKTKRDSQELQALAIAIEYWAVKGFPIPEKPDGSCVEEVERTLSILSTISRLTDKINKMAEEYKKIMNEVIREAKNNEKI